MSRGPQGLRYQEALGALQDAERSVRQILAIPRLPREAQRQLLLLAQRLAAVVARDNGRSR